ncbi:MAG: 5-(carboxyamino)imidazole ribonucleotide synthase, partial [Chitinophagales bacterium]
EIHILDPSANAPCAHLTAHFTQGDFKDFETVYQFGKNLDVITIEIEHVNTEALYKLEEEGVKVIPTAKAIETIKDKGLQKQFYADYEIRSSLFQIIENKAELQNHTSFLPFFQKARKDGYDGKGVVAINSVDDFDKAFDVPSVLEKSVDIEKEISVIVAKDQFGNIELYPVVELVFDPVYNLVDYLIAPAQITEQQATKACRLAKRVCEGFHSPGLFAVELFLSKEGEILVNETAPRAHNSGHHTIEASISSQFDQHLRILLGLPLGSTKSYPAAAMINLVGSEGHIGKVSYEGVNEISAQENVYLHLYGKEITKPGRKMGHVSVIGSNFDEVLEKIDFVKKNLRAITR